MFVAKDRAEAIRLSKPYLEIKYREYHRWGQDKAMPEGDDNLGQQFDDLLENRFILGSPDEVAEGILELVELGINHLIMSIQWPGMPQSLVLETMQTMAEEVFPKILQGVK